MPGIEVLVNGEPTSTAAETLEALLIELDYSGKRVATAINGQFIPAVRRATSSLQPGDRIEIVSARQGG